MEQSVGFQYKCFGGQSQGTSPASVLVPEYEPSLLI